MTQENNVAQAAEATDTSEMHATATADGTETESGTEQNKAEANKQPATADGEGAVVGEVVSEDETPINAADAAADVGEAAAEPTEAQIIADLQAQLAAAEGKNAELVDNLQRTAAEFQNSRRRQEKQLADAIERAGSHTVERLLPVIDDLALAFGNLPAELDEATNAWVGGFRQIYKKLETMLADQGVSAIPLEGEFDPNRHEAVSSEPSETVESGHIIETLRIGYEYKGRVLRPALVRVAM